MILILSKNYTTALYKSGNTSSGSWKKFALRVEDSMILPFPAVHSMNIAQKIASLIFNHQLHI
jgi:hypothetical protein